MKERHLYIASCDLPAGFEYNNSIFQLFSKHYNVSLSDRPEIVLYGCFGRAFLKYDCTRVYYSGENTCANFQECDYAFSSEITSNQNHFRYLDYASYGDARLLLQDRCPQTIAAGKSRFCNFIYSNWDAFDRIRFCTELSKYKSIDALGSVLRNRPEDSRLSSRHDQDWIASKLSVLTDYKFTIAFENESHPGYVTEKLFHSMLAGSIPIYWGNPLIERDFNTKAFVNVHSFSSFKEAVQRVIEIDNNDEVYYKMLGQPYFNDNRLPALIDEQCIAEFIHHIVREIGARPPIASKKIISSEATIRASLFRKQNDTRFHASVWRRLRNRYYYEMFKSNSRKTTSS